MGRIGTPQISFNRFKVMSDALKATGRNILLNLCNWGEDSVHTVSSPTRKALCSSLTLAQWGMSISNSWRITGDIYDSFTVSFEMHQTKSPVLNLYSDQMICVAVTPWLLAILPALLLEPTAQFFSSSTKSLLLPTAPYQVAGAILTCWKSAKAV